MQCINCGKKLTKDEKICPNCGKKHPDNQEVKTTKNKTIFYSLSAIFLGISLTFLALVVFYSLGVIAFSIFLKEFSKYTIIFIVKMLLVFVIPPYILSVILKLIGGSNGKIKKNR